MDDQERQLAEAQQAFAGFVDGFQSLLLATVNAKGEPNASYAPFVRDEAGAFYIFVSGLSRHTANLRAHPGVSVLLIEEESQARQVFARQRLTYECEASAVPREEVIWEAMMARLRERFGDIIGVLAGLPDFVLFRLEPRSGSFVIGFGQAYRLSGERLETLNPIGPAKV